METCKGKESLRKEVKKEILEWQREFLTQIFDFSVLPWTRMVLWNIKWYLFNWLIPRFVYYHCVCHYVKLCVTSSFHSFPFYCEDRQVCCHPSRPCHLQKYPVPMGRVLVLFVKDLNQNSLPPSQREILDFLDSLLPFLPLQSSDSWRKSGMKWCSI